MAIEQIQSSEDLQNALSTATAVTVHGGQTKSALQQGADDAIKLDVNKLTGILEYEPGEYTFTALAGTPLSTVEATLAEHGQYLPFDPPFVERGATLGGTVATALSGSGRYRFGGVRDFLIGVRFVDGQGRLVRGGGKVVKNAAGFDLPKLMVGSLGQFGVLTEVSFKVFPRPEAYTTLTIVFSTLSEAVAALQRIVESHFDIHALDLKPIQENEQQATYRLLVRLGGLMAVLPQRLQQLQQLASQGQWPTQVLTENDDAAQWRAIREFSWLPPESILIKVALTAKRILPLEELLVTTAVQRHYAVGGNLAWIGWSGPLEQLDTHLQHLGLTGLILIGQQERVYIGKRSGQQFAQRIKSALDPHHRLPDFFGEQ